MGMARNSSPWKMDDLRLKMTQIGSDRSRDVENAAIPKSLIILGPVDKLPSGKRLHNYEKSSFFQ